MSSILFVHAHPDDELLATGIALVRHARLGHDVHVLTCTLGDEGEVIPAELAHLEGTDDLAPHRREELAQAMSAAGARHRVLGERDERTPDPEAVVYRDSGMAGSDAAAHPHALVNGDLDAAAQVVRDVIEEVRADVVITYDERGGYEHPDHIRTHEITCRAVAGLPAGRRPALFAQVTPLSWAQEDRAWVAENVTDQRLTIERPDAPFPAGVVSDDLVTHHVLADAEDVARRDEALRAHRTQVTVYDGYYALSNDIAARLRTREGYALMDPATGRIDPDAPGPTPGGTELTDVRRHQPATGVAQASTDGVTGDRA